MRYYTKSWYGLMQSIDIGTEFKKIPDKDYSTEEIENLYQKKLQKEIRSEKKIYNTEPFFLFGPDEVDEENFDPEEWIIVDEKTQEVTVPESVNQVKQQLLEEQKKAKEEFDNRPPFDPEETIAFFEETYRMKLENSIDIYPDWLVQKVDSRLLALDYLPETAYKKFKEETRAKKKEFQKINQKAKAMLKKQNIPEDMEEALSLHDATLLSMQKKGKDFVMIVRIDEGFSDGLTPYRRVVFRQVKIIERESRVSARKRLLDDFYDSDIVFLYHEIYRIESGFEIHMMFHTPKGLGYVTLQCTDLERKIYKDEIGAMSNETPM